MCEDRAALAMLEVSVKWLYGSPLWSEARAEGAY